MKMKRQRKNRWLGTDGKCRENEKTEKVKMAENIWQRQRKLNQIKKNVAEYIKENVGSDIVPRNDYVAHLI